MTLNEQKMFYQTHIRPKEEHLRNLGVIFSFYTATCLGVLLYTAYLMFATDVQPLPYALLLYIPSSIYCIIEFAFLHNKARKITLPLLLLNVTFLVIAIQMITNWWIEGTYNTQVVTYIYLNFYYVVTFVSYIHYVALVEDKIEKLKAKNTAHKEEQ